MSDNQDYFPEGVTPPRGRAINPTAPFADYIPEEVEKAADLQDAKVATLRKAREAKEEMATCIAKTKGGGQCKNKAVEASEYCRAHARLAAAK